MNFRLLILLTILYFFSCSINDTTSLNENEFKNKTFLLIDKNEKDTLNIEFKDSTYYIIENSKSENQTWKLSQYNNLDFLSLNCNVFGIDKLNDNTFLARSLTDSDWIFKMAERTSKWDVDQIYGYWVEEKYFSKDSTDFPPPPIKYTKYSWPPYYNITKKKIELDFYDIATSNYVINNTFEYIDFDLNHPFRIGSEIEWKIKSLNDSIMVIDRILEREHDFSMKTTIQKDIKLFKRVN